MSQISFTDDNLPLKTINCTEWEAMKNDPLICISSNFIVDCNNEDFEISNEIYIRSGSTLQFGINNNSPKVILKEGGVIRGDSPVTSTVKLNGIVTLDCTSCEIDNINITPTSTKLDKPTGNIPLVEENDCNRGKTAITLNEPLKGPDGVVPIKITSSNISYFKNGIVINAGDYCGSVISDVFLTHVSTDLVRTLNTNDNPRLDVLQCGSSDKLIPIDPPTCPQFIKAKGRELYSGFVFNGNVSSIQILNSTHVDSPGGMTLFIREGEAQYSSNNIITGITSELFGYGFLRFGSFKYGNNNTLRLSNNNVCAEID